MSSYDDPDSPDYRDTNVGEGMIPERTKKPVISRTPPIPAGLPREADVAWLRRFINCAPFQPPPSECQRAHTVVTALEEQSTTARAQGRQEGLEEAAKVCDEMAANGKKTWDEFIASGRGGPATSYHQWWEAAAQAIRELGEG